MKKLHIMFVVRILHGPFHHSRAWRRRSINLMGVLKMNKFSVAGTFKAVMAASVLTLLAPSAAWATDHLLSVNGATVSQPAVITHAGTLTQPLILSDFDGNTTLTLGGGQQTLTVVSAPVKMCKPGTNNQLEWLDQGNTVVGVTGVLTSGTSSTVPNNGYRLTLTMTGIIDTYGSANGTCEVSGQKTYTYTGGAVIDKRTGNSANYTNKLTSTYNFWNATNGVPEPGTVALMLLGLLGMGWMSMKRMRAVRGVSA
jgi:hypothetical protein